MRDVVLRRCAREDLDAVYRVEQAAFGGEGYSPLVLRQLLDILDPWFRVAATADGEIVAYTVGGPRADDCGGWILSLGVHAQYQKRGIGRMLSRELLERFRAAGIHDVRLTVEPTNRAAIGLYESLGFSTIEFERSYFGEGGARNVMLARLDQLR